MSDSTTNPEESILQEAHRLVHGPRQADYGHPLDDFTRTAAIWSALLGVPVTAEQVGLCMIAVKLSRQVNHPKRDNLVDAAGYAATVHMVLEEQERRAMRAQPTLAIIGNLPEARMPLSPAVNVRCAARIHRLAGGTEQCEEPCMLDSLFCAEHHKILVKPDTFGGTQQ